MNQQIRIDRAEVEQQPGGKTIMVPLQKLEEGKKDNLPQQNNMQKDTLFNLFLSHLLRPKEWTA